MLYDGKYIEGALLAFENNYTQLFIKTVNRLFTSVDENKEIGEVTFEDGKLMVDESK